MRSNLCTTGESPCCVRCRCWDVGPDNHRNDACLLLEGRAAWEILAQPQSDGNSGLPLQITGRNQNFSWQACSVQAPKGSHVRRMSRRWRALQPVQSKVGSRGSQYQVRFSIAMGLPRPWPGRNPPQSETERVRAEVPWSFKAIQFPCWSCQHSGIPYNQPRSFLLQIHSIDLPKQTQKQKT